MVPVLPARRRLRRTAVVVMASSALMAAAAAPASADSSHGSGPRRVASGLDNPRQLTITDKGDLFVAESGTGGSGPCLPGPEGPESPPSCFGRTGAVTMVSHRGGQSRVLTRLPSLARPGGVEAIGPSDVEWLGGGRLAVVIGLGRDPALRASLPPAGAKMGTLQLARLGSNRTSTIADLAAYEASANPSDVPDSNPSSVLRVGSRYVITDSGGNDLVRTNRRGNVSTLAVFPEQMAVAPPFLGLPPGTMIPAQAVPTAVVRGPDGAYYVSQLTGFPFQPGLANIYRVPAGGGTPTVWASGLTNVTSLAFGSNGRLYAVQIADAGLLATPEGQLPSGSLVRVTRGGSSHKVVADGLQAPYGLAIRGSNAYVTTCSVCPDGGEVWRIRL